MDEEESVNVVISSESSDDEWITNCPKEQTIDEKKKKRKEMSEEEQMEMKILKKQRREASRALKKKEKEDKLKLEQEKEDKRLKSGRLYTLSIAVPGSIVDNAQSKELKVYLAGQIARAAAIFEVDEIVIFDDQLSKNRSAAGEDTTKAKSSDCHTFLRRILQYLETPQYLRKLLFPVHDDLKYAGLLNPLACPHHMRSEDSTMYREGVVVDRPLKKGKTGAMVNIGLRMDCYIDTPLPTGTRVTVKLDQEKGTKKGKAVSSAEPRESSGTYWGYTTRIASSLTDVWAECPFKGGYDLKIGTSERGNVSVADRDFKLPQFKHGLIVFGGVAGLEECTTADETISTAEAHTMFDLWLNTCPQQGSRTIRSEEAVLISLAALRPHINMNH